VRPVQGKTKVARSRIHGWGVFAAKDIRTGEVVEMMPALPIRHDHISAKGHKDAQCILNTHVYNPVGLHEVWVGTGNSSFFNAAHNFNAEIEYDWDRDDNPYDWIRITAIRPIRRGEEITLDYLQDSDSDD